MEIKELPTERVVVIAAAVSYASSNICHYGTISGVLSLQYMTP